VWFAWGRVEVFRGLWLMSYEGKNSEGRLRLTFEDDINIGFREIGWMRRTGFCWLRIEFSGGRLLTR